MRPLSADGLRFLLHFAVGQLEPALLRDLTGRSAVRKAHAHTIVVDRLLARFDGHQVLAPTRTEGVGLTPVINRG